VFPRPAELAQTAEAKTDFPLDARRKMERVVPVNVLEKKKIQKQEQFTEKL